VRSNPALKTAATPRLNNFIRETPFDKQAAFLLLPHREVLYGGSAGPGKSSALLMAALQYVDKPGYAALLLRRTYADLSRAGALMDRARAWLSNTEAIWNGGAHMWRFPSGASLSFGYLEHDGDELQYQSAEYQCICFDELTQFTEAQYRFLFSRLRRPQGSRIPLRMRAATNPGGPGHEWVKQRFILAQDPDRFFLPARFTDNPYIDQAAYRRQLAELDPVTRKRFEEGDWDVAAEGALFKRSWFAVVKGAPAQAPRVRFWDMAATAKSIAAGDPDYIVGVKMVLADGLYYVEHVVRERVDAKSVLRLVLQTAQADGAGVVVCWEQEGGSSGKIVSSALIEKLAGFQFRAVPVHADKLTRALPFRDMAQAGNVRLVEGAWNLVWLDEVCGFPTGRHDDQVDASDGAFVALKPRGWAWGPAV